MNYRLSGCLFAGAVLSACAQGQDVVATRGFVTTDASLDAADAGSFGTLTDAEAGDPSASCAAIGITFDPVYASLYTCTDLGPITEVPVFWGGMANDPQNPDVIQIESSAEYDAGFIYDLTVTRDVRRHVTGFAGTAKQTVPIDHPGYSMAYASGVLFAARWSGGFAELTPGKAAFKPVDHPELFQSYGLAVVPSTIPKAAGQLKLLSSGGFDDAAPENAGWWTVVLAPDGMGTYNATSVTRVLEPPNGAQAVVYVPNGSPGFSKPSVMVAEFGTDALSFQDGGFIVAYEVDDQGDPILNTRQVFLRGTAQGMFIDSVSGDFIFTLDPNENAVGGHVVAVHGFLPPPQ
jgi:hypothetical protein